ncbi:MAG TPA: type II toxin-antitoxin system RelE/ParE family toxin [Bryobacteraceae bacterium]|jgi:plasmid stabilization system protein ParE
MNPQFVLSPEAALDLVEIWRYILRKENLDVADRVESVILEKLAYLAGTPGGGHSRKDLTSEDVRFFPVYSYLIVYRARTIPLEVVAILHGGRELKRLLKTRLL